MSVRSKLDWSLIAKRAWRTRRANLKAKANGNGHRLAVSPPPLVDLLGKERQRLLSQAKVLATTIRALK
jgi:hypothetical protein